MSKSRNIHLQFPCSERIENMQPNPNGLFCSSCSKTILDLRQATNEDIQNVNRANSTVCGIFSLDQMAKGYENYKQVVLTTVLALGLSSPNGVAQNNPDSLYNPQNVPNTENLVVGVVFPDFTDDITPEYPGGIPALRKFILENAVYPEGDTLDGKVYLRLFVDSTGSVTKVTIKKSLSPLKDAEAIRVAKLLKFIPAKLNGKKVNSYISLPVTFRSKTESEKTGQN